MCIRDRTGSHSGWCASIDAGDAVSYTHLRAHETLSDLVCRLLLEKNTHLRAHETSAHLVC
ncbi:hypothetical protein, partial [Staphylococcus aureus]